MPCRIRGSHLQFTRVGVRLIRHRFLSCFTGAWYNGRMTFYHEKYCFVPWRQTPEGYEPALPDEVSCELLADLGRNQNYDSLYVVRWLEDVPEPSGIRAVVDSLKSLLISGRSYPPALALARAVRFHKEAEEWSEAEAGEIFTDALRAELDNQRERPFFLAKATGTPNSLDGYKTAGCYYWIVGYKPSRHGREIAWVSEDFFVYQDPVTDFEVDAAWLCERFGVAPQ